MATNSNTPMSSLVTFSAPATFILKGQFGKAKFLDGAAVGGIVTGLTEIDSALQPRDVASSQPVAASGHGTSDFANANAWG
jgi:hypothetical protein